MKSKLIPASLFIVAVLFSCKNNADKAFKDDLVAKLQETKDMTLNDNKAPLTEKNTDGNKIPVGNGKEPALDSVIKQSPIKPAPTVDWDKKIIKTATLKLEVKNFKAYNETVHKTVKQFGGNP